MSNEKFIEETPHYEDLTPEQIKIRDKISYLSINSNFKVIKKQFKKQKDGKK
jgi:hypothetical protein